MYIPLLHSYVFSNKGWLINDENLLDNVTLEHVNEIVVIAGAVEPRGWLLFAPLLLVFLAASVILLDGNVL